MRVLTIGLALALGGCWGTAETVDGAEVGAVDEGSSGAAEAPARDAVSANVAETAAGSCVVTDCDCGTDELGNQWYGWSCRVSAECVRSGGGWCCPERCAPRPSYPHCGERDPWSCQGGNAPDFAGCDLKIGNGSTSVWCCG